MKILINAIVGFICGGAGLLVLFLIVGWISSLHDRMRHPYMNEKNSTKKVKK